MMSEQQQSDVKPWRVVIVEDDLTTLEYFTSVLAGSCKLSLCAVARSQAEAIACLETIQAVHVVLVDLGLPDGSGIDVIAWLRHHYPHIDSLVMTAHGDEDMVIKSLEAGASGYLLKHGDATLLEQHIVDVILGGSPINAMIARTLLNQIVVQPSQATEQATESNSVLSKREHMVLQQIAKGFSAQEIAGQMGLSSHTVSTHVKRIYRKLHVNGRSEAVYEASVLGLIDWH